jgi:hypothetical protein
MIAIFTFNLVDLIAGLTNANQWEWHGRCRAEIENESALNRLNTELTVQNISECHVHDRHILANFDKQPAALELQQVLSAAKADGTADAMIIDYHSPSKEFHKELLGITIGLRSQKYELFRTFVTLHFGKPDLIGRIICRFYGFVEPSRPGLKFPTKSEFLKGRPYLVIDNSSFVFSSKPLP